MDKIRVLKRVCDKNCEFEVAALPTYALPSLTSMPSSPAVEINGTLQSPSAITAGKQPKYPSCGSVFKNGAVASGKLIEDCGLKGTRCGGAEISALHGNFIVNIGGATAADFMTLVRLAGDKVLEKYGIQNAYIRLGIFTDKLFLCPRSPKAVDKQKFTLSVHFSWIP